MVKKYIRFLIIGLAALAAASCSISPDIEDRPELKPAVTSIAAPSITDVINDNASSSISIMWDPVDKASFYVVEYQSALDYLAGNDYREFITQTNSFTLESQYFTNASDMRYVFRVKAGSRTQSGSSILYSPYSELREGVIVNSFSVSPVIQNSTLTVYSSFPKIRSVLSDSSIVSPSVAYYDGDYTDGSALPEPLPSSSVALSSAEEKTITAVLSVDGKEVTRKKITVQNSVDYYPPHLYSIEGSKNEKGSITITWTAPEINKGLDSYGAELKFVIERKKGSEDWKPLKDSSGNDMVLAAKDFPLGSSFSYTDSTAEPNADYSYRVISEYFMTINGNDVVYAEDKQGALTAVGCYTQDTMVKSFMIRPVSGFDGAPVTSGDAEYKVALEWETYHELPENIVYSVTRWDYDQITFVNGSPTDEASSTEKYKEVYSDIGTCYEDTIKLEPDKNKKAHNYVYYIQLKEKDASSSDYPMTQSKKVDEKGNVVDGIIKTNPSVLEVSFIKDGTLKATSGNAAYSDKIELSWSFDEEAIKAAGLSVDKVSVHVQRKEASDHTPHSGIGEIYGKDFEDANVVFADTNVESGVIYNYMLRPYYNDTESLYNGEQTLYSDSVSGSTLKEVTGLTASMNTSNSEISVSWDKVEYAHGYRVYYRKSGEYWSVEKSFSVPAVESFCTLPSSTEIVPGTVYEITVCAIDASGNSKPADSIVRGSILGHITPAVTGDNDIKADSIAVSWDKVENAASYKISIYDDNGKALVENKVLRINDLTEANGRYEYTFSTDSDEFRAYAEAEDADGNLVNEYALSREYRFSVVPVVRTGSINIEPDGAAPISVGGYWIMPPKNITATKAAYRDLITISWNPVDNASGYIIYYKQHGASDGWSYLNTVSGNMISLDYLNSSDKLDFSVSSVVNGQESAIQSFFESDSNYGYPLIAPQRVACVDLGNGFFKLSFMEVLGSTDYIISIDGVQYDILTSSKVDSASSSLTGYTDKAVEKSASGMISYYIKKPDVKYRVTFNCSVAAMNSAATIDSKNTTSPIGTDVMYSDITEEDEIRLALYNLNYIFTLVNSSFDKEWWPSSQKTLSDSGISASTCWGTSGFASYNPKNNGYIRLNNFSLFGNTITGNIACYVEKNQSSGYLGDDPLERVSTDSNLVINLPGKYEDIVVSFSEYYVNNSSGIVTINGKTVSLDKISPTLLQEV